MVNSWLVLGCFLVVLGCFYERSDYPLKYHLDTHTINSKPTNLTRHYSSE